MYRLIYILITLMMVLPSIMMAMPYPVHATTTNITVTGESGYQYHSDYTGGAVNFTNMQAIDGAVCGGSALYEADYSERAWTLSSFALTSVVVNSVTVYSWTESIINRWATPFVRIGGVNYYGTRQFIAAGAPELKSNVWSVNPATLAVWTPTEINAAYWGMQWENYYYPETGYYTCYTDIYYATVDYTANPPSVTTGSVSPAVTTVTLNGAITATGGADADQVGFVYGTTSIPVITTNITPPNGYTSNATTAGTYGVGAFSKGLTGLVAGTTYYYRAYAHNTYGWNYGSESSFTTVGVPSISTQPATSIATTSAQPNSLVVNDGNQLCDVRFGLDTSSHATNFTAYASITPWGNNSYATGTTPFYSAYPLVAGTKYYYNVQIANDAGTTYGVESTFTTYSGVAAPTDLIAIPNSNSITLVWTKGVGSAVTYIRYSTSIYPNTTADGLLIYSGALGSYTHTNLTAGTTYYYSAWGMTGTTYSTDKATALGTTTAGATTSIISVPTVTGSKWVSMPSELGLVNFPLYSLGNWVADTYSMPRATFWVGSYMLMVILFCMIIYMKARSNNLLFTGITGVILLGFGTIPTPPLIPIWVAFAFIIILAAIGWVVNRY
jgi:hypothetical protein